MIIRLSRHSFTTAFLTESTGILELTEREPFRFRVFPDNIEHVAKEGDTLHHLAFKTYRGIAPPGMSSAQFFWILADFQPQPIVDPTVRIASGTVLFIPSRRVLIEEVFSQTRRKESNVT